MIPISDINPAKNIPIISRIFIIVTALIFIFITPKDDTELFTFFYEYAAIPCEIFNNTPLSMSQFYSNNCLTDPDVLIFENKNITFSLFVSLFLHANFLHVLGNLWSFWIFGNNTPKGPITNNLALGKRYKYAPINAETMPEEPTIGLIL